jgi:hypothetical protein
LAGANAFTGDGAHRVAEGLGHPFGGNFFNIYGSIHGLFPGFNDAVTVRKR